MPPGLRGGLRELRASICNHSQPVNSICVHVKHRQCGTGFLKVMFQCLVTGPPSSKLDLPRAEAQHRKLMCRAACAQGCRGQAQVAQMQSGNGILEKLSELRRATSEEPDVPWQIQDEPTKPSERTHVVDNGDLHATENPPVLSIRDGK